MKPTSNPPHDPLDELLAAALHGELTDAQRTELAALLQHDPAARAAHQETLAMHDILERNHREVQPDASFEERLISGVRRQTRTTKKETAWESALFLWRAVKWPFVQRPGGAWATVGAICALVMVSLIYVGRHTKPVFATINGQMEIAEITNATQPLMPRATRAGAPVEDDQETFVPKTTSSLEKQSKDQQEEAKAKLDRFLAINDSERRPTLSPLLFRALKSAQHVPASPAALSNEVADDDFARNQAKLNASPAAATASFAVPMSPVEVTTTPSQVQAPTDPSAPPAITSSSSAMSRDLADANMRQVLADAGSTDETQQIQQQDNSVGKKLEKTRVEATADQATRKLVRNATLDLEVKSFQPTVDAITGLCHAAGGYLDSSALQRGGNGKLQGSVVAKVLPENLDAFLLKLRELGQIKNQSVSTEDVTKDYYDTQARIANSLKMETQLQQLLSHNTNKVADLLEVERELGRVRGEIEQMQGQIKLYDFQVQYATVTITVSEKDLNKAAAYLLRENDSFSLFTGNVEDAFSQAKAAADTFHAEILSANLQHNSDHTLGATLAFSVPPDQIDGFLVKVKGLGRVDNFTRQTQRVANDGGDADDPADETKTEKDPVQVQLTIRADDETPRQTTQMAIISTGDIDTQAQQLKDDAIKAGAAVTASNFERATDGTETATLAFRLALSKVGDLMPVLQKLGKVEALTVQRNDRPDQAATDPSAPAEIDLRLHNVPTVRFEDQTPRQQTQLAIASSGDVDAQALQVKSDALAAGDAVTGSTFERAADGTETATINFRLALSKAADFLASLKKLGRVEGLSVQRNDAPDQPAADASAPAEIDLRLHSLPPLENQAPRQQTQIGVVSSGDVDAQSQHLKADALKSGYAVIASTFQRSPDGTEQAAMTFRLPLAQAAALTDTLKQLGKVESLAVQRHDVPDADANESEAAEISLTLHNEAAVIGDDRGFWATIRNTFGGAATAFFGSVQTIGIIVAFIAPWLAAFVALAWIGRRAWIFHQARKAA